MRLTFRCPKLLYGTFGWFEQDGAQIKSIHFVEKVACKCFAFRSFVSQSTNGNDT